MGKEIAKTLKFYVEKSLHDRKTIREAVGVDPSTMSRHLNGKIPLTYNKLRDYSKILGIHLHQLVGVEPIKVIGECWNDEDTNRIRVAQGTEKDRLIYPKMGFEKEDVCILKGADPQTPWLGHSVVIFNKRNMLEELVDLTRLERWNFVKFEVISGKRAGEQRYKLAIPYSLPFEPGKSRLYRLLTPYKTHDERENEEAAVKLIFNCPIKLWVLVEEFETWNTVTV
jgi:hypothetical protein